MADPLAMLVLLVVGHASGAPFEFTRPDLAPVAGYTCAEESCKALGSCEEACYKLIVCGQTKRDADHDGIPCENLCSAPCR